MDLLTWLDESFPLRFALTLLHFLWQGCVVTLVVLFAGWMLRRASAGWRYLINVAAMLLMVACLPVTFAFVDVSHVSWGSRPDMDGFGEPSHEALTSDSTSRLHPLVPSVEIDETNALADGSRSEPDTQAISHSFETSELSSHEPTNDDAPEPGRAFAWIAPAATYLTAVYFLGVAAMIFRLASGLWGGVRLRRLATPVDEESLLAMIQQQARRIGLKTAPAIAYCEQVSIPVLIGIIKPTILLPAALASGLSPDQLQALVMHELAHIRRYDLLVNLLQRLIEAVLFFHPAVWYVSRRVSMEREHIADDAVVAAGWRPVSYADALVRMAELSSALRNTSIAKGVAALAASGGSPTQLTLRVQRLLDSHESSRCRLTRGGLIVFVLLFASVAVAPVAFFAWVHAGDEAEPVAVDRSVAEDSETERKERPEDSGLDDAALNETLEHAGPATDADPFANEQKVPEGAAADEGGESSLEVKVLDLYGQPITEGYVNIWRLLSKDEEPSVGDWHDPATQRTWRSAEIGMIGLPNESGKWPYRTTSVSVRKLIAGTYLAIASSSTGTGPFAVGEPFRLDGTKQKHEVTLRMDPGGKVRFEVVDQVDGKPLIHSWVRVAKTSQKLPPRGILTPHQDGCVRTFEYLPAGSYQFSVGCSALNPGELEYDVNKELHTVEVVDGETKHVRVALKGRRLTEKEIRSQWPWIITGTVTDAAGKPIEGALVRALDSATWEDVLGSATTDERGKYAFRFRSLYGFVDDRMRERHGPEEVVIAASKSGLAERNLNRQGLLHYAYRLPTPDDGEPDIDPDRLLLPEKPREIDFVLVPALDLAVKLVNAKQQPEDEASIWWRGVSRPQDRYPDFFQFFDIQGECVFTQLAPSHTWWFRLQKESGVERTPPLTFAAPGKYTMLLAPRVDRATGLDGLQVVSVTDGSGTDVTERVVGYEPLRQEASESPLQVKGQAILRKMREVNRYWLGLPPAEVKNFRYVMRRQGTRPDIVTIRDPAKSTLFERRGFRYMSAIDQIVRDLDNVIVRKLDVQEDRITMDYKLHLPAHVQIDAGLRVDSGTLIIDPKTHTLMEHQSEHVTEKMSQYVEIRKGRYAPLRILAYHYDLRFRVHRPGLWLFERAYEKGNETDVVAYVDSVSLNLPYEEPSEDHAKGAEEEVNDLSGSVSSQAEGHDSRYEPESPHLKARLDDVAELLDLPEGTDPTSVPFKSSRPAPHILGAADVKMSKVPTDYESHFVQALGDQGACKSVRPGDRVAVVQPFKGDEDRHFVLVADATVVALSVPYSYHRINETTATVFVHPADPKAALVNVGTITTEMTEDESPVLRTVTLVVPRSNSPKWDASWQMREDLGHARLVKYVTRDGTYDFRKSKAYAELEDEQRIKLETVDRDVAVFEAALTRYVKDHEGTPPMTLDVLVPHYIAELPKDPFATEETAADRDLGQYKPSLDGWGYRYKRRDRITYAISSINPLELQTGDGSWEVRSVGLPDYRYRAANARGLYQRKGYWGRFVIDVF